MSDYSLITCVVQRGKSDKVVKAALNAGAEGVTTYYGRGTGVREKLGVLGNFIQPEKEIILIVVKQEQKKTVFDVMVQAADLNVPGQGIIFAHTIDDVVGFVG